jgi:hypothetical protein
VLGAIVCLEHELCTVLNWVVEIMKELLIGAHLKDYLEERRKNVERY